MFDNIIGQKAVIQLSDDIQSGRCAPSMLFYGPGETGKGSAALELSRVLSCESNAAWKCPCYSCDRYRYLLHDDLLILGKRSFSTEIAACGAAFLRNVSVLNAKILFFRSIRKLQIRFSPVLLEDDSKLAKNKTVLQSLDEKLNEFWALNAETSDKKYLEKLCMSMIEDALVLENENLSSKIPIGHIRSASSWCRLAPNGKRKTLIIENADNMKEEAHNSLLKLLEEPPSAVNIVLTTQRREAIITTILSRLRQYRFFKREIADEKEVIRLVFRDVVNGELAEPKGSLVSMYLEKFAFQNSEKLYPLAAWFIVSLARLIAVSFKKNHGRKVPEYFNMLGEHYKQTAESLITERAFKSDIVIKNILEQSENFKGGSFSKFLKICLDMLSDVSRSADNPQYIVYNDLFKKFIKEAVTAVEILNIKEAAALDVMIYNLKKEILAAGSDGEVSRAIRG